MLKKSVVCLLGAACVQNVAGHIALWHPSMWGFNMTEGDNRPVDPLADFTFDRWWFHGHLDHPPNNGDVLELPAGDQVTVELACHKGHTSYNATSGGPIDPKGETNSPCPGAPSTQWHTENEGDVAGCALGIVQKSDVNQVSPEDFVIFSVNHKCVWTRMTDFKVPADMPACPPGGCTCAWFWIHSADSGSEQMYMNGFRCDITGAKPDAPALGQSQVARRCGLDPASGRSGNPSNCTQGAKQPLYWLQKERNNMFEGILDPPVYNDLYGFKDGAQDDIFQQASSNTANLIASPNATEDASLSSSPSPPAAPSSSATLSSTEIATPTESSLISDSKTPTGEPVSPGETLTAASRTIASTHFSGLPSKPKRLTKHFRRPTASANA
ncbi:hypothetical protein P691DRAFT_738058 [Macrolepiota fuliginosa MF-IS2]|uniref:Lytic polysaccharide monooxygenase n=1 Tax=Macrolepiota fuliginosa MF-IS2 TaxID=1400762 RepID=A0A9P6BXP2_9AGAR|nr:hypothetical protein P691DRAFT_738058 [Macrolepiota fuliginosa MF-IS2]